MNKLMYANFGRMKKDMVFWLCNLAMFLAGIFFSVKTTIQLPLDRVFFAYVIIIGLVMAVFSSLYIGTEHQEGTIRNKVIAGHTKTSIYLANLFLCIVAGVIFSIAYMIPMLTIGIARLGVFEAKPSTVVLLFITTFAASAAFAAIDAMISLLCQSKATVAVICMLCFLALMIFESRINSQLQAGPTEDCYSVSADGVSKMESVSNPNYLSGTKREIYQFVLDFLPAGQAVQFVEMTMVHTWQLPVYSLLVILLVTGAGIVIFRRKNIR